MSLFVVALSRHSPSVLHAICSNCMLKFLADQDPSTKERGNRSCGVRRLWVCVVLVMVVVVVETSLTACQLAACVPCQSWAKISGENVVSFEDK
jgi:hypothetical protein